MNIDNVKGEEDTVESEEVEEEETIVNKWDEYTCVDFHKMIAPKEISKTVDDRTYDPIILSLKEMILDQMIRGESHNNLIRKYVLRIYKYFV